MTTPWTVTILPGVVLPFDRMVRQDRHHGQAKPENRHDQLQFIDATVHMDSSTTITETFEKDTLIFTARKF